MYQKIYRTLSTDETTHSQYKNATRHIKNLIKTAKHLKARSSMINSQMSQTLTNFHTDHLRETIHNNQDYQKIFLTTKSSNTSTVKPRLSKNKDIDHINSNMPLILNTYSPSESTHLDSATKPNKTANLFYSFKHSNIINPNQHHAKANAHFINQTHTYTNNNRSNLSQTIGSTSPSNHSKSKLKLKLKLKSSNVSNNQFNNKKRPHTRNHYQFGVLSYNPEVRTESLTEFLSKVNIIGREKYIQSLQNEYHSKLTKDAQTKVDEVNLDIHNYSTSFDLLKMFTSEYEQYQKHLYKIINKERDTNDDLKDQVTQLKNDIDRLNKKQTKLIQTFNENYKTKFFLMCVKNSSNQIGRFAKLDIEEFKNDQFIIQNLMNSNNINSLFGINNERSFIANTRKTSKRLSMVSQQISNGSTLLKQYGVNYRVRRRESLQFSRNEPIFDTPEEFYNKLEFITQKISLSLNDYNIKEYELQKMRKEHQLEKIEDDGNATNVYSIEREIKEKEEELAYVKERHTVLSNTYKNLPQVKVELIKVRKKVKKMVREYDQLFPIEIKTPRYNNKTVIDALLRIEKTLISLQDMDKTYKEIYPQEYMKMHNQIEKQNKIKQTRTLIMLEKMRIMNKNNRVIEKSTKFIFKPYRKMDLLHRPIMTEGNLSKNSKRLTTEVIFDDYL